MPQTLVRLGDGKNGPHGLREAECSALRNHQVNLVASIRLQVEHTHDFSAQSNLQDTFCEMPKGERMRKWHSIHCRYDREVVELLVQHL